MQIFSKIDIGRVRSSNQDAYFTGELSDALSTCCAKIDAREYPNIYLSRIEFLWILPISKSC